MKFINSNLYCSFHSWIIFLICLHLLRNIWLQFWCALWTYFSDLFSVTLGIILCSLLYFKLVITFYWIDLDNFKLLIFIWNKFSWNFKMRCEVPENSWLHKIPLLLLWVMFKNAATCFPGFLNLLSPSLCLDLLFPYSQGVIVSAFMWQIQKEWKTMLLPPFTRIPQL